MRTPVFLIRVPLLLFLFLIPPQTARPSAAECADPTRDLYVWMSPGSFQLPGIESLYDASAITWNSQEVQIALSDLGVEQIGQAFPDFYNGDSTVTRPDNVLVSVDRYREVYQMRLTDGTDLDSALVALEGLPDVYHVERVGIVEFTSVYTNDPMFRNGSQWGLYNYGQTGAGTAGHDIKATTAWSLSKGSPSAQIAMIDAGAVVEASPGDTVQDLVGRLAYGSDTKWNSGDTYEAGHGFNVAGVIAAAPNNNIGTTGIAWDSPLLSLTLGDPCKDLPTLLTQIDIAEASSKIINNSYILSCGFSLALGERLAKAYKAGKVIVAGTGKSGSEIPQFPAAYGTEDLQRPNMGAGWGVIAVGSVGISDTKSSFSNWGRHVDVVGPGENVYTTSPFNTPGLPPHVAKVEGTSFTAPMVSALASLMLAKDPTLTNDDIEHIIRYSADDILLPGWDSQTGEGRINARRALEYLDASKFYRGTAGGTAYAAEYILNKTNLLLGTPIDGHYVDNGAPFTVQPGTYCADLYRVEQNVMFPLDMFHDASRMHVWVEGTSNVPGLSSQFSPQYGIGFGARDTVVALTTSGCRLYTYIWKIGCGASRDVYIPCDAPQIHMDYAVLEEHDSPVPSASYSFYVPQTGDTLSPTEGTTATRLFRACPNNCNVGSNLPNDARIKVVVKNAAGAAIPGIAAADIEIRLNGGSPGQEFAGPGADSVIANSFYNSSPLCPDVFSMEADGPTDASGTTYITFRGVAPGTRGVSARNPLRKWGHYDSDLPVYVLGTKLSGRLTSTSENDTYVLRIKNMDWTDGLDTDPNGGEAVGITDLNGILNGNGINNAISYWKDLNGSGSVDTIDGNIETTHINHNCSYPENP